MGKSHDQTFLDKLAGMPNATTTGITNAALRDALKWEVEKFDKVRDRLLKGGKIKKGVGHGGKTILVNDPIVVKEESRKLKVFISYSHKDDAMKDALLSHLKPLERLGLVASWHDRSIEPGQHLDDQIQSNLQSADLILLLISIDFINSDYCYQKEMETALARSEKGEARVVPVILRSCHWHDLSFGRLKALPKDGRSVQSYPHADEAYTEITKGLHKQAEDFIKTGSWNPPSASV